MILLNSEFFSRPSLVMFDEQEIEALGLPQGLFYTLKKGLRLTLETWPCCEYSNGLHWLE